jgi:hypothetical protein
LHARKILMKPSASLSPVQTAVPSSFADSYLDTFLKGKPISFSSE